ncbi:VWA domain-containing protein [bacterium]|nr:VWA domain-containing protein [bacterium]
MKKIIILFTIICLPILAYDVYMPSEYSYKQNGDNLLFVVDFSNSMGEFLHHKTKVNLVKEMLRKILPQIDPETKTGIRVYGHTCNIFAYNACRSSELIVPLNKNNSQKINSAISKLRPKGMTPITYSLKQSVKKDFSKENGMKHIILLTDGGENCDESPCDYAIELMKERRDIKIDVIAFNVHDADDLAQLKCVADVTTGRFVDAKTNAQLVNSMEEMILPHKQVEALIYGLNN